MKRLIKGLLVALVFVASAVNLRAQSPVSWWQGEGNLLDSAGTNNGNLNLKFSYGSGISNQCFQLKGGFLRVTDAVELKPANVSVQFWVKGKSPGLYLFNKFGSSSTLSY